MVSIVKEKSINLITSQWFTYILLATIFACIATYVYLANSTVRTLTVLEKIKVEVQARSVGVSELESKRLSMDNTLSSSMAKSLGLREVTDQTFIVNKARGKLSFNTE
jgi:hypothetical protein